MGTQVQCKSYFPGYYSMRDLNEDSNISSWPLYYGDKTLTSGQFYNSYVPRTITDVCPGYDKDALKQKMLEHEAVFKNQVCELHRLYRIQRDMMEEIRRKEIHSRQMSIEPSSSSSLLGSQMPSEDAGKWHISSFPLSNSGYPRPSVSGAEIVNSPLSCTKGNNVQAGRVNGSTSKDCEVIEVRPSKVRKKLFDLQLPADEYIDTEEGEPLQGSNMSNISSSLPNGNNKIAPENRDKLFLCGSMGKKFDYKRDASTSESCRSSMRFADLNEPVQLEEGTVASSVDNLVGNVNCTEAKVLNLSAKPSPEFLGLQKEITPNVRHRNQSGTLNGISVGNKSNERDWLSGHKKNNLVSVPQGLQQDQLPLASQPGQASFNKAHQHPAILPTDYGRADLWRERAGHNLETFDRIHDNSKFSHLESAMTSQIPSQYPSVNSSDIANSWSHSSLAWGKPTSSLTEKLNSFHAYPSLNSSSNLGKSSQSSAQSHGILGEKWHINGNSRLNPGLSDIPIMNGFCHGSSSGSKETLAGYPSVSFNHLNCNGSDNATSGRSLNHRAEVVLKGTNYMDVKPVKDMDLNVVHSKCSSNEAVPRQDVEVINDKCKPEEHLAVLPWLRAKPASKSEAVNLRRYTNSEDFSLFKASPNQLFHESKPVKDPNKILPHKAVQTASDCEHVSKKDIVEGQGIKKILGFPIFEKPSTQRDETSSPVSASVSLQHPLSGEKLGTEWKTRVIDINLACDEEIASEVPTLEKEINSKVAHIRNYFDLNSCISEDEDPLAPSVASNTASVKIAVDIDLEAPVLEAEDDIPPEEAHERHEVVLQSVEPKPEQTQDEVVRMAAEAIVLLSSSDQQVQMEEKTRQQSEDPLANSLLWFADVVSTCEDTQETKGDKELNGTDDLPIVNYFSDEMDDFEVMTLQLQETKEEDYMPKSFVPEVQKMEETGANSVPNRPRKGQSRRGRQRRDFQRDILPGLASLSRHEVTEDLQIFGGLMRATGHPWNSGLTRRNGTRNGGARGRRRAVVVDTVVPVAVASASCTPLMQQLNNIESGLEDRSLTGWGKTTRRPRRQRCPAGNPPPSVPLT